MKKRYSLRRRLIARMSIPITAAILLMLALSSVFAWHEIEEVYDAQLVHSAKILSQFAVHEMETTGGFPQGFENADVQHKYERNLGVRIWYNERQVTASPHTQKFGNFQAPPGFSDHVFHGKEWRFFVFLEPKSNVKVEVSEPFDIRYELIVQLVSSLLVPLFLFFPLVLLTIWVSVRKILQPVVKLSNDVDKRSSSDLAPIPTQMVPEEINPLLQATNRLLKRLEESFRHEREFTDNAAHELRTPLAAMKTQTQVLLKKAKTYPELAEGLENLHASINRATRLVQQLLALARLQSESLPQKKVNLSRLIEQALQEIEPSAQKKHISLQGKIDKNCFISGHETSVSILLNNLLDNAVKYTPVNGRVDVELKKEGLLTITDTGAGLSEKDKSRVFDRFVRVDRTGQVGHGLGLAIVKWVADTHKASIKLENNKPKGLKVSVLWPEKSTFLSR